MSLEQLLSSPEMLAALLLLLTIASILIMEKLAAKLAEQELKKDKRKAR